LIPLVRNFIPILSAKGYTYQYHEYHEGHSWGFWRAHIDDALEMFFPYQATSVKSVQHPIPPKYHLFQNYPNPFNPETKIQFDLESEAFVSIKIFNVAGQIIRTLIEQKRAAGNHAVIWDGTDASGKPQSSGIYLCALMINGSSVVTQKMVLVR
jgi:enterochelin esterase family protein